MYTNCIYFSKFQKDIDSHIYSPSNRDCYEQQALKHTVIEMNSESSDDGVEAKQQRNLDVATTASLDLVALNNKVKESHKSRYCAYCHVPGVVNCKIKGGFLRL